MERFDRILKDSLTRRVKYVRSLDCPSEVTLSEYLDGELKPDVRERVESHLGNCLFCQETLVLARKALDYQNQLKRKDVYKRIFKQRWLILASISFYLSFFFSRYFLQFLIVTLIFSLKWILSPEVTKNLIMIFKSFPKAEKEEKIFERK